MSQLYPDLTLSTFPNTVDTFTQWLNITATDGPQILAYKDAVQAGNTTLANQILAQIPSGTQKIIKATDLNKITQAILAVERFYFTDIEPYLETQQQSWLDTINQFSYKGTWSSGSTYETNNIVTYTTGGYTFLFLATATPPTGTAPTNTTYWRVLTIQGQQGPSGEGLSYRQAWSNGTTYSAGDVVTYQGALWSATQASQNAEPTTGSQYWQQIMSLTAITYPIQDTQPTNLSPGGLWFNTSDNPTPYHYLAPLSKPATAAQITSGYQAYDANGNLITGTRA